MGNYIADDVYIGLDSPSERKASLQSWHGSGLCCGYKTPCTPINKRLTGCKYYIRMAYREEPSLREGPGVVGGNFVKLKGRQAQDEAES